MSSSEVTPYVPLTDDTTTQDNPLLRAYLTINREALQITPAIDNQIQAILNDYANNVDLDLAALFTEITTVLVSNQPSIMIRHGQKLMYGGVVLFGIGLSQALSQLILFANHHAYCTGNDNEYSGCDDYNERFDLKTWLTSVCGAIGIISIILSNECTLEVMSRYITADEHVAVQIALRRSYREHLPQLSASIPNRFTALCSTIRNKILFSMSPNQRQSYSGKLLLSTLATAFSLWWHQYANSKIINHNVDSRLLDDAEFYHMNLRGQAAILTQSAPEFFRNLNVESERISAIIASEGGYTLQAVLAAFSYLKVLPAGTVHTKYNCTQPFDTLVRSARQFDMPVPPLVERYFRYAFGSHDWLSYFFVKEQECLDFIAASAIGYRPAGQLMCEFAYTSGSRLAPTRFMSPYLPAMTSSSAQQAMALMIKPMFNATWTDEGWLLKRVFWDPFLLSRAVYQNLTAKLWGGMLRVYHQHILNIRNAPFMQLNPAATQARLDCIEQGQQDLDEIMSDNVRGSTADYVWDWGSMILMSVAVIALIFAISKYMLQRRSSAVNRQNLIVRGWRQRLTTSAGAGDDRAAAADSSIIDLEPGPANSRARPNSP